jgi:hypothetical protein
VDFGFAPSFNVHPAITRIKGILPKGAGGNSVTYFLKVPVVTP